MIGGREEQGKSQRTHWEDIGVSRHRDGGLDEDHLCCV
jgi:hypothetical protein